VREHRWILTNWYLNLLARNAVPKTKLDSKEIESWLLSVTRYKSVKISKIIYSRKARATKGLNYQIMKES
jgi:hypothetical protein